MPSPEFAHIDVAQGLAAMAGGTHEATVVPDIATVLFAPHNDGEVVDPNAVFVAAMQSGLCFNAFSGGYHFRETGALARWLENYGHGVNAYITNSLEASVMPATYSTGQ